MQEAQAGMPNAYAARPAVPLGRRPDSGPSGYRLRLLLGPAMVELGDGRSALAGHNAALLLSPDSAMRLSPVLGAAPQSSDIELDRASFDMASCELGLFDPLSRTFSLSTARLSAENYLNWRLLAWQATERSGQTGTDPLAQRLARGVLIEVARGLRGRPSLDASCGRRQRSAEQAAILIETHWQQGISLAQLAGHCQLSPGHLLRSFRRCLGLAPHQYLLQLRLRRSIDLLACDALRIVDIALSLGFASHGHFAGAFRRAFGISPLDCRRRIRALRVAGNQPTQRGHASAPAA